MDAALAKYFLIATPERMYLWKQEPLIKTRRRPQFTIDAEKVFPAVFPKLHHEPVNIGPEAFELVVLAWLMTLHDRMKRREAGPGSAWLSELAGPCRRLASK